MTKESQPQSLEQLEARRATLMNRRDSVTLLHDEPLRIESIPGRSRVVEDITNPQSVLEMVMRRKRFVERSTSHYLPHLTKSLTEVEGKIAKANETLLAEAEKFRNGFVTLQTQVDTLRTNAAYVTPGALELHKAVLEAQRQEWETNPRLVKGRELLEAKEASELRERKEAAQDDHFQSLVLDEPQAIVEPSEISSDIASFYDQLKPAAKQRFPHYTKTRRSGARMKKEITLANDTKIEVNGVLTANALDILSETTRANRPISTDEFGFLAYESDYDSANSDDRKRARVLRREVANIAVPHGLRLVQTVSEAELAEGKPERFIFAEVEQKLTEKQKAMQLNTQDAAIFASYILRQNGKVLTGKSGDFAFVMTEDEERACGEVISEYNQSNSTVTLKTDQQLDKKRAEILDTIHQYLKDKETVDEYIAVQQDACVQRLLLALKNLGGEHIDSIFPAFRPLTPDDRAQQNEMEKQVRARVKRRQAQRMPASIREVSPQELSISVTDESTRQQIPIEPIQPAEAQKVIEELDHSEDVENKGSIASVTIRGDHVIPVITPDVEQKPRPSSLEERYARVVANQKDKKRKTRFHTLEAIVDDAYSQVEGLFKTNETIDIALFAAMFNIPHAWFNEIDNSRLIRTRLFDGHHKQLSINDAMRIICSRQLRPFVRQLGKPNGELSALVDTFVKSKQSELDN